MQVGALYTTAMGTSSGGSSGLSAGGIAGSVIGSLVGVVFIGLLCWCVWARREPDGGNSFSTMSDNLAENQHVVEMGNNFSDLDNDG